ncbi:hypothetical protein VXC91_35715 [Streptomyces chiangmaiensis]|uniref:Uncharacterized protein n=1 Tax=Streptomyces chiangmaiensis TaxID=766497 RepID=A0ABU7FT94_9ACTN|nr:hypothetical protein [Streptomyces chiangmaiensis]MED7827125.1 hypothetical protein [Streptomyces chiangmaiensis]
MVVEKGEQVHLAAIDPQPVQRVPDPEFVGPVGLEPAEGVSGPGRFERDETGAVKHPLQRALVRRPAQLSP